MQRTFICILKKCYFFLFFLFFPFNFTNNVENVKHVLLLIRVFEMMNSIKKKNREDGLSKNNCLIVQFNVFSFVHHVNDGIATNEKIIIPRIAFPRRL